MQPSKEYLVKDYADIMQSKVNDIRKKDPEVSRNQVLILLGISLYQAKKLGLTLPIPLTKAQIKRRKETRIHPLCY